MPKGYKRLVRRRVWRRETEKGVEGLDQIAPFEHRPADRISGMICRVFDPAGRPRSFCGRGLIGDPLDRRTFVCALTGGLLAAPPATAQEIKAGKVDRLGMLTPGMSPASSLSGAATPLPLILRELGYKILGPSCGAV